MKVGRPLLLALVSSAGACSGEFVLGERPAPDGLLALSSGPYFLSYGAPETPDCVGEIAGRADAYAALDAAAAGLVGGRVDLTVGDGALTLRGAPIDGEYEQPALRLTHDPFGEVDPDALAATVPIERAGLEDTRALVGGLVLATADDTAAAAHGWATVCYARDADETTVHACTVRFAVSLEVCCWQPEP